MHWARIQISISRKKEKVFIITVWLTIIKAKMKKIKWEFPLWLSRLRTWLVSMKMCARSLALLSGLRIWCYCELQCRSAAAAPIQPLAWELPCYIGIALKKHYMDNHNSIHYIRRWFYYIRREINLYCSPVTWLTTSTLG